MSNELVSIACPIYIAHTIFTCPAFADDIAFATKSESTLQYIVDEAVKHSNKRRYSFNFDKIRILSVKVTVRMVNITMRNQLKKLKELCYIISISYIFFKAAPWDDINFRF